MGLGFADDEKPRENTISFFKINTNARPQQLYGEVIPELIHRVGDVKSRQIPMSMVEQYMDRNIIVFDRALLKEMFDEADFRKAGALDERSLAAALSGRYPKRYLTGEWRMLVALLLDIPQLVLTDDVIVPKGTSGTFNSESIWDQPPPALPPIKNKGSVKKTDSATEPKAAGAGGEAAASAGRSTTPLTADSLTSFNANSSETAKAIEAALAAEEAFEEGPALSLPNFELLSSKGIKTTAPTEEEMEAYRAILKSAPSPRSKDLGQSTRRDEGTCSTASHAAEESPSMRSTGRSCIFPGIPKQSIKAWSATLPPSCISISGETLQTMRQTVRGTFSSKPEFITKNSMLTTADLDRKKTLGKHVDVSESLARVEPVRSTSLRYDADYVAVGDYASNCRTGPTRWDLHPAAPVQAKEPSKYPWGISS
eukprot:gene25795-11468_t